MEKYVYTRNEKIIRGVWLTYTIIALILTIFQIGLSLFLFSQAPRVDWSLYAELAIGAILNIGLTGFVYHCAYRKNGTALLAFLNFFGYIGLGIFGYQYINNGFRTHDLGLLAVISLTLFINHKMRQVNKRVLEFRFCDSKDYVDAVEFFKNAVNVDELKELFATYMRQNERSTRAINQAFERKKKQLTAQ